MDSAFWLSYATLWLFVVVTMLMVLLLYRQFGLMLMPGRQRLELGGLDIGSVAPILPVEFPNRRDAPLLSGSGWESADPFWYGRQLLVLLNSTRIDWSVRFFPLVTTGGGLAWPRAFWRSYRQWLAWCDDEWSKFEDILPRFTTRVATRGGMRELERANGRWYPAAHHLSLSPLPLVPGSSPSRVAGVALTLGGSWP